MIDGEPWMIFLDWVQRLLRALDRKYAPPDYYTSDSTVEETNEQVWRTVKMLQKFFEDDQIKTVEHLGQLLCNGDYICYIIHVVNPAWIEEQAIHSSRQLMNSSLLPKANIELFIDLSEQLFRIPHKHVIKFEHLFHLSEFGKLIDNFSYISQSDIFQERLDELGLKIPPFKIEKYQEYNLEQFRYADEYTTENQYIPLREAEGSSDVSVHSTESVDIKGYVKPSHLDAVEAQSILKEEELTAQEAETKKRLIALNYVMAEIEETEDNYVNQLQYLQGAYRKTLVKLGYEQQVKLIMDKTHIEMLSIMHTDFLSDIVAAQRQPQPLIDAFMKIDRIRIFSVCYTNFLVNYDEASRTIEHILANLNDASREVMHQTNIRAATSKKGAFTLKDNFLQPFQRFCRYPILLRELLSKLKKLGNEEDISKCDSALQLWQHVVGHLNTVKADEESKHQVFPKVLTPKLGIFVTDPLTEFGRLIKDETLKVTIETEGKHSKTGNYNVLLFQSVLILSKSVVLDFKTTERIRLECDKSFVKSSGKKEFANNVKLTFKESHYIFHFASQAQYNAWKEKLELVVDSFTISPSDHHGHHLKLTSVPSETECQMCAVCGFVVRGLVFQAHRCIKCHIVTHADCRKASAECVGLAPKASSDESNGGTPVIGRRSISNSVRLSRMSTHGDANDSPAGAAAASASTPLYQNAEDDILSYETPINNPKTPEDFGWFIGMASKQVAKFDLEGFDRGTFCVRSSDQKQGYRIAVVNHDKSVKHIQVFNKLSKFYLVEGDRKFCTLMELIEHYKKVNLSGIFGAAVDTALQLPLQDACLHKLVQHQTDTIAPIGVALVLQDVPKEGQFLGVEIGQVAYISNDEGENYRCGLKLPFGSRGLISKKVLKLICSL